MEISKTKHVSEEPDFKLGKRVADFLPSPKELAEADDVVRVTMFFSKKSVEFFKQQAKSRDSQYQKMIRRLVDSYVDRHALV